MSNLNEPGKDVRTDSPESIWALMAAYGLVALAGFYLAISNYSKLRAK